MVTPDTNQGAARPDARGIGIPLIRLTGITKVYPGGATALTDATLEVHPHEFIVVVGPSGAGKSTMLRCMNLLVRPTSGRLEVGGQLIRGEQGRELRMVRGKVGMIFQQFGLVGRLSVFQNVLAGRLRFHSLNSRLARLLGGLSMAFLAAFVLGIAAAVVIPVPSIILWGLGVVCGMLLGSWCGLWCWVVGPSVLRIFPAADRLVAMDALRTVGIVHLAERRADQLSGGQQQRVAIARTLAQEPTVVLADEPIASLDPVSAESVMDSLRRINQERGIPIVVNLHQVDVARRYATRIIGMSGGRIVFDGPPENLTASAVDMIYRGTGVRELAAADGSAGSVSESDPAPIVHQESARQDYPNQSLPHKEQPWVPSPAS